jgi:hypothetical protein
LGLEMKEHDYTLTQIGSSKISSNIYSKYLKTKKKYIKLKEKLGKV